MAGSSIPQEKLNGEVESTILDMVNDENAKNMIFDKLVAKVDISSLEEQGFNLKAQLAQVKGSKRKLGEQMIDLMSMIVLTIANIRTCSTDLTICTTKLKNLWMSSRTSRNG